MKSFAINEASDKFDKCNRRETLYKCPICNSEFAKEQDFIKHVSSVHERKSLIKVPIVLDISSSEDDSESKAEISTLNKHTTKQTSKINSRKSKSSMENKSKLLNCKSCDLKFINASSLIKHIEKNHLKSITISTNKAKLCRANYNNHGNERAC